MEPTLTPPSQEDPATWICVDQGTTNTRVWLVGGGEVRATRRADDETADGGPLRHGALAQREIQTRAWPAPPRRRLTANRPPSPAVTVTGWSPPGVQARADGGRGAPFVPLPGGLRRRHGAARNCPG